MSEEQGKELASVAQLQKEFKPVIDEMTLRVKELRELQTDLEEEKGKYGEGLSETKAQMEKIEERIGELQTGQEQIRVDVKTPRLTEKESVHLLREKKLLHFFRAIGQLNGIGDELTSEELAELYPDGRKIPDGWAERGKATPEQARALVENTTGQILVPEDLDKMIIRTIEETAIIRPLATVRTTTSDRIRYRSMTEVSVNYGQKLETGGTLSESDQIPSEAYQYVEDMHGLAKIGEDELMDADIALVQEFVESFARSRREVEDDKYLNGSAHASHEPEGLLNSTTITRITAANAGSLIFEDLVDLMYGYETSGSTPLKEVYRRNGVFIMHPFTELAAMKVRGDGGGGAGTGQFMWQAAVSAGVPNTLWGHNTLTTTNMPVIGTGLDSVLFGDIRSTYRIIDRMGSRIKQLNELYIESGLIGLYFKARNTGGIIRAAAARVLQHP